MSMLGRGLRTALGAINRPMPTKKAGRGAEVESKELFDKDADNVLRSGIENLSKKDFYDNPDFDDFIKKSSAGGEIQLEELLDLVPNNEVADSIITKLIDKDGAFQLSIDEVKDLAQVYQKSDVPNQQIMGELITGMLEGNFDGPSMGALRNLPND